jgi:hypothetical protein
MGSHVGGGGVDKSFLRRCFPVRNPAATRIPATPAPKKTMINTFIPEPFLFTSSEECLTTNRR